MSNHLYHNRKYQWSMYLLFFSVLAAIPLYVTDAFLLNQFALYGVFGLLAISISLCWGAGGILNLGQGVMFGLSAYGMAMTMQMQSQDPVNNPIPPFMLNNGLDHLPWFDIRRQSEWYRCIHDWTGKHLTDGGDHRI